MTIFQANVTTKLKYNFSSEATYVIAGGLGGLGRSFARWMVARGARNLALLSRSGAKSEVAKAFVSELETQGVTVATPMVDISSLPNLGGVLADIAKTMPPVRGCIQATVALRVGLPARCYNVIDTNLRTQDNLFENMTYEDWVVSTNSKVTGSWNLHRSLPADLDFFILLSSVNGIFGGRAQANYGAGNTFKDSLAHYRVRNGQKAVSIDLGLMVTEGIVSENEFLLSSMRRIGHLMEIAQEELIALLDHYCDPSLPVLADEDAQILVGIEMPSAVLAKGIDLHHLIRRPMFRHLFRIGLQDVNKTNSSTAIEITAVLDRASELTRAASQDEAISMVTEWFSGRLAQVLGLSNEDIDPSRPVHSYGVDSLVAIDLKNWLEREIGANITVFELLGNMPLNDLSTMAVAKSRYRQ